MIQDNLTILFTVRNTLHYLKPAIASFLKYYPDYKRCITVFDDDSTDGARDWVEANGMRVISWTKYRKLIQLLSAEGKGVHRFRFYNHLLHDAADQITTKFLLLCDSDVVFLKGGFIEDYWAKVRLNEIMLITPICDHQVPLAIQETKYSKYSYIDTKPGPTQAMCMLKRVFSFFTMMNLEYLKKNNVLFDSLSDPDWSAVYNLETLTEGMLLTYFADSGSDWYYKLKEKQVPFLDSFQDQYCSWFLHQCDTRRLSNPNTYVYHFTGGATYSEKELKATYYKYKRNPIEFPTLEDLARYHPFPTLLESFKQDPDLKIALGEFHPWLLS